MFGPVYFGPRYFGPRYFGSGGSSAPPVGSSDYFGDRYFGARYFGRAYWGGGAEVGPPPSPAPSPPAAATGGWPAGKRKRSTHDFIDARDRERLAELVRAQRIAMGIIPAPARKAITEAVKKVVKHEAPVADLAPVVVDVAQSYLVPAPAVTQAVQAAYDYQLAFLQAQIFAEATRRQLIAREAHHQRLLADDEALLQAAEAERAQVVELLRGLQRAMLHTLLLQAKDHLLRVFDIEGVSQA